MCRCSYRGLQFAVLDTLSEQAFKPPNYRSHAVQLGRGLSLEIESSTGSRWFWVELVPFRCNPVRCSFVWAKIRL